MTIEGALKRLEGSVWEIEDVASRRSTITEDELVDISLEWDDAAFGVIPLLLADAESGKMPSAKVDRLDGLLSRLRSVADVLTHFDLAVPARMELESRHLAAAA